MATVDKNDSALTNLVDTKNQLINEAQANYNNASQGASQKYNELIQASKDYGKEQADIQQQQTNQTIAEINQNKEKTERDYLKEQKGAYVDYANQTNKYGVNAEKMAAQGLLGSGYQESSKVSMYNAYQNRVAVAKQSFNDAIVQYDNQITQAQIANSAALAEIAYNSLQTQLKLSLEGLQYENELLQQLTNTKLSVNTSYDNLWQSMYNTLLDESQFNEQMAYQKERDAVADRQWEKEYALSLASSRRSGSSSSKSSSSGKLNIPDDEISDYARSVANNLKTIGNMKGKIPEAVINKSRNEIANLVNQGTLSQQEAEYIFSTAGL